MGKVGAVKFRPFLIKSKRPELCSLFTPSHYRDSPRRGTGDRIPQTPCVAPLRAVWQKRPELCSLFNPSHYRDSPRGALGTGFPRPLASLRSGRFGKKGRNFVPYSTPVTIVTAPEGIITCGFCKSRCSLELCACSARWCREGRR